MAKSLKPQLAFSSTLALPLLPRLVVMRITVKNTQLNLLIESTLKSQYFKFHHIQKCLHGVNISIMILFKVDSIIEIISKNDKK